MKLLTKNYIEDFTTITASTGSATANAYDRDFTTKWVSVGSDDTTTETYEVIWTVAKTIDRIALLAHNCKDFNIQYWNGAAYVDFTSAIDVTGGSDTDNLWEVTEVSTLQVKLSVTKTHVVDAEKSVGQFMAYSEYFDLPDDDMPDTESIDDHYREFQHELSDGGTVLVTEVTVGKFWATYNFNNISKTYRDEFKTLKELHLAFWVIPDDSDVSEQYYVNMTGYKFDRIQAYVSGIQAYQGFVDLKET